MIKLILPAEVKKLLSDKELFGRISDDSITYDDFYPPNNTYLGIYHDDNLAGFWWLIPDNNITVDVHCNVLKDYRKHSKKFAKEFADYMITNHEGQIFKLICKIPEGFDDVYHFTKNSGFVDEGIDRLSIMKNGKILNRRILGITMQELKTWAQ